MPQDDKPTGLVKESRDDPRSADEIAAYIVRNHPVEYEEQIDTLDSPLIIECACPGWQPREWPSPDAYPEPLPQNYEEGGVRYPPVPCSIEEQAEEIVKAVEAGCAAAHIHPRDPDDCLATSDVDLLAQVYDRIFERTDAVSLQHSWERTPEGVDHVEMAKEHLEAADGGNKYIQGALVLWPPADSFPDNYPESAQVGVEFYHEHGIKPIHKVRSSYGARQLHRNIVQEGYAPDDEPIVVIHDMGHPYGWPMDDNEWMPIEMMSTIGQTKQRFPDDTIIGVYSGNRNWMPVTMMAILAGVDMVRIGIEDPYFMYPHKDEVIQENIDCVRKITEFCERIGREMASPEQAREMLGMELT